MNNSLFGDDLKFTLLDQSEINLKVFVWGCLFIESCSFLLLCSRHVHAMALMAILTLVPMFSGNNSKY